MSRIGILLAVFVVVSLTARPALALDCADPTALTCGVTSNGITIGNGAVPADPTWCNGAATTNTFAHIFSFTVTTDSEVTVSSTSPLINFFLLNSCDQDDCLSGASGQGTPTVTACVPAGTYLAAASTLVDAIFAYSVNLTCDGCTPIPVELHSWGRVKELYR